MRSGETKAIAKLFTNWWLRVQALLEIPLIQIDPLNCSISALNILAKSRNVNRFKAEPLDLYRLRVEHAYINAVDAGSAAGLQRIFVRLGIGYVELLERQAGRDFDIITLSLSNSQLSQNQDLLRLLVAEYGRTCRRYEFNIIEPINIGSAFEEIRVKYQYDEAS